VLYEVIVRQVGHLPRNWNLLTNIFRWTQQ